MIAVRSNEKGRGVYALKKFKVGDLIEIVPLVLIPMAQIREPDLLGWYVYDWDSEHYALALGFGSLYNHSYTPNAVYFRDRVALTIAFHANRRIEIGEEICVNYNGDPDDMSPVPFDVL